jgi:ASCH domain.
MADSKKQVKELKFARPLPEMVLDGEKDTTWRIDDEREITVNDRLSLQDTEGEEFAEAKVLWIKMTTFDRLTEEDKKGHESFRSEEEMLETYSNYYNMEVKPETEIKIVKFELIS